MSISIHVDTQDVARACCAPVLRRPPRASADADELAAIFKALADPGRLRLLSFIAAQPGGEACVCHLTEPLGLSQPTVSHHLKVLTEAGLLERERRGTWMYYRLRARARSKSCARRSLPPKKLASAMRGAREPLRVTRARPRPRRVGTAFLLAAVVGSGIMGERLVGRERRASRCSRTRSRPAPRSVALILPSAVSGAHLNPAGDARGGVADASCRGATCPRSSGAARRRGRRRRGGAT